MLAPLSWIKKYVDIDSDIDIETLTHKLTMTGSEVEGYEEIGKQFDNVVVGKIEKMEKHPDADRLQICSINVGKKSLQIVTGATNVFPDALVPVALVGANLPNGMTIKKGKLRGVTSFGMLCSGEELQIDDSIYPGASVNGIMLINEDYEPGTPIAKVLGLDEVVIDIKTYANRPDSLSIVGTAREAAATFNLPMKSVDVSYIENEKISSDFVSVKVKEPELCPRYMARIVYDIKIEPSPKWMQKELIAAGVRPISNIVDITNYVMLELGQPMHAFDFKYVEDQQIVVRKATDHEKIITLDEKEYDLNSDMLVIADAKKPSALAGIMGGHKSGVYDDTDVVLFESATFNPISVRSTARALGIRTESSARFEKGLDASNTKLAMDRAMHLVELLGVGKIAQGAVDILNTSVEPKVIEVSVSAINKLLGLDLPGNTMDGLLRHLQIESKVEGDTLICEVPPFRQDLHNMSDIAEEVMRIYGYDKIPNTLPEMHIASNGRTLNQRMKLTIRGHMVSHGLYEAVHYSFMSPSVFKMLNIDDDDELRNAVEIVNPLGEDYSLMRTTLCSAMINSIANNVNHRQKDIKLFEMSKTFHPTDGDLPVETNRLCIGVCADNETFFTLKGRIEALFKTIRIKNYKFVKGKKSYLHPGRTAEIYVDDVCLGYMGELHPDIADKNGIKDRSYIAEIDVDALMNVKAHELVVKELPKYPAIDRDLAVVVDRDQPVGELMSLIKVTAGKLLESIEVFDVYEGKQVPEGKKSVAFSLMFRSMERTLEDKDVNTKFDKIVRVLERNFNATLR